MSILLLLERLRFGIGLCSMEKKETTLRNEAFEVQSRYSFGLASKVFLASTFNLTNSFNFQPGPNQDSKYKRWQLKRKKLPRLNLRHKQENKFKLILSEKWEIVQVKFCASISSTSFWMCARECVCVLGRVRVWVGLWGRLGVCVRVWVCVCVNLCHTWFESYFERHAWEIFCRYSW